MTRQLLLVVTALAAAPPTLAAEDVRVQTALSQTALWVGQVVTYTVTLTCRPTVDILQGDLDADKLALDGLQVVGQSLEREATNDGALRYVAVYRLTTFDPGVEKLVIGDWTVRYAVGAAVGASTAAQELRVPGAALAWRSALPDEPKTLALRGDRAVEPLPVWWRNARATAWGLIAVALLTFGVLVATRVASRRPRTRHRKARQEATRDLRRALNDLGNTDITTAAARVAAYEKLETALRTHVAEVTGLPAAALTPAEMRERASGMSLAAEEVSRILDDCQRARFAPVERVPDAVHFRATLESAAEVCGVRG